MRTLLIVDDEKNIRLGLKAIIEREYPGVYDMRFAADGEEALALLKREKVDIIITDIRMPGMDGLSLIQQNKDASSKPAVIILSGYDDFQYAKEAIKYNVKEYLLKPIVREEMYNALQRVELELKREEEIVGRLGASERDRCELQAAQLNYIFMHGNISAEEVGQRCRRVGLDRLEPAYYTGVLKFSGENWQNVKAEEFLSRQDSSRVYLQFEDKDGHLVIMADQPALFDELIVYLTDKSVSAYYVGLSELTTCIASVNASYKQAKHALKYSLFQTHSRPILIRHADIRETVAAVPVPIEDIRRLANMLGTDREKEMKALLIGLLDLKAENTDITYIESVSRHLNELVFDRVFHEYGEESVEILRLYKQVGSIYHFATIHDYFHQVESLLVLLNDYIRNIRSAHAEHKEMKKAIQYIQERYNRDLNMATVSNYVSLNYSYFSQLFKEYTGQSFVNYVKKVRIEKAKELLQQTGDKVYEIGRRVGFENAKQFNRVFRDVEGISASEYRHKQGGFSMERLRQ